MPTRKPRSTKPAPVTDAEIAKALTGDPEPLSWKRYDNDFFAVILSSGQKYTFSPEQVRAMIKKLRKPSA